MAAREHPRHGFWASWFRAELSSISWIMLILALAFGAAYAGVLGEALSALRHD